LNQLDFDQIKANALAAIPTLKLSEAVTTPSSKETPLSFLIEKRQVVPDSKGLTSTYINKYLLNPYNENIYLTASKNISIAEHYNRSYRGDIEVTSRSNYLAVINVVDFEKYLYSVVTSEMGGFSLEALKAQAVAARTFALTRGNAYVIANISDTTADQAYNGAGTENENCRIAVDSTSGIVMMYYDTYGKLKLASPYYSSNMGGQTAVGSEVWGNNVVYTKSVASPDQIAESNVIWYRVIMSKLPSSQAKMVGTVGYIHSDYLQDTGRKTGSGQSVYTSTTAVKIRTAPSTSRGDEIYVLDSKGNKILDSKGNPVPLRLNPGDEAVKLEQVRQWNSYSWITRDYSGIEMKTIINKKLTDWNKPTYSTSIKSLVVSKRGPSNRLMEVKANGQVLPVSNPDRFRSILGGIWSTKDVEIENSASYTVLGADGKKINSPDNLRTLYAISASSPSTPKAINQAFIALNKNNRSMYRTIQPFFRIKGKGNGHGLGMSQWGAEGLARQGKKYDYILNYYFKDITLQKGTN
jgi:stage II sporulation protein D